MSAFPKEKAWRDPRVAAEYEARRFRSPLQRVKHRRDTRVVTSLLGRDPEVESVLDLPCGTSRLGPALEAAGYTHVGADLSLAMLRAAPTGAGARVQAHGARLPFRADAFDAVVSLRFLFHVPEGEERDQLLSEMRRVARRAVVGQVRYRHTGKHLGRYLRSRVGLASRYRPSRNRSAIAAELERAGLALQELLPVSRAFSDKALFLALPVD